MVCALPLFLPIPVGNAAQECSPPLETSIRRSFASTDDSSRRGIDPLRSGSSRSRRRRRNEFAAPVDMASRNRLLVCLEKLNVNS